MLPLAETVLSAGCVTTAHAAWTVLDAARVSGTPTAITAAQLQCAQAAIQEWLAATAAGVYLPLLPPFDDLLDYVCVCPLLLADVIAPPTPTDPFTAFCAGTALFARISLSSLLLSSPACVPFAVAPLPSLLLSSSPFPSRSLAFTRVWGVAASLNATTAPGDVATVRAGLIDRLWNVTRLQGAMGALCQSAAQNTAMSAAVSTYWRGGARVFNATLSVYNALSSSPPTASALASALASVTATSACNPCALPDYCIPAPHACHIATLAEATSTDLPAALASGAAPPSLALSVTSILQGLWARGVASCPPPLLPPNGGTGGSTFVLAFGAALVGFAGVMLIATAKKAKGGRTKLARSRRASTYAYGSTTSSVMPGESAVSE